MGPRRRRGRGRQPDGRGRSRPRSVEPVESLLHTRLLALLGIPLGEFFDLDALAEDCAADGVYEYLFTSKPLGIPGGVGSPPNAMAIK